MHRLVADHRRRAVVVVSVRRIVVADAVVELDGGVASLPGGLVVANRGTVMSGPRATRRRPHRPRGLNRCGAPNLRAEGEGAEPSRNPQYVGDIVFFIGVGVIANSVFLWIAHLLLALVFVVAPLTEEPWLEEQYGDAYREYRRRVPRFL